MKNLPFQTVGVAGAGVMGAGIAYTCALAGYRVVLFDLNPQVLEKAMAFVRAELKKSAEKGRISQADADSCLDRISPVSEINRLKADLIIEAILENLGIKKKLFSDLEQINDPDTILASNTSSIPITRIAAGQQRPGNITGVHFFNPAHIMKLVEVISGAMTDETIMQKCVDFVLSLGKTPIRAADAPGFIVNRVARHYYVEGLKIMEEGVAEFEQIDRLAESAGFKMGPFRLMDLIGVDTNYSVTSSMYELFGFDSKFRPNRIQKQKVDAGLHGRKTGKGFYSYEP